ncbi:hypothetical protein OAS39_07190 [Pirellulales bacterium]|nr:hypothetical protein [Pirellulales bacterium]
MFRIRYNIRDFLWLTLLLALCVAWLTERAMLKSQLDQMTRFERHAWEIANQRGRELAWIRESYASWQQELADQGKQE